MARKRTQTVAATPLQTKSSLSGKIAALPRLARMLLVALFALAVTLAVSPLVDLIYDRYFFSVDTVLVPALISAGFGLLMYLLGWWLMVGTVGEPLAARPALVWYVGMGFAAVGVVLYLIVIGVNLLNFAG
jgi:hypothetical protein